MEVDVVVGAAAGMASASILIGNFYMAARSQKLGARVSLLASAILGSGVVSGLAGTSVVGYGARKVAILLAGAMGGVAGSIEGECSDFYTAIFSGGVGYGVGVFQSPVIDAAAACVSAFALARLGMIFAKPKEKEEC